MKLFYSATIIFSLLSFNSKAAFVDTVSIYSKAMNKSSKCLVITPASYKNSENRFPVVYLLHGYSDNYSRWITQVPGLKNHADQFQMIIVCPDGNYGSWYVDSPVDSTIRYDTYISTEVPGFIDSAYRTMASRNFRAIAGLSMGGHGAMSIAWKHSNFFGAVGSMSGLEDLTSYKNQYQLVKILGNSDQQFYDHSVVNIVKKAPSRLPAIIFDCGISDQFIETNRKLHNELLQLKIPHDYIERNGVHNWGYWKDAVGFQLMFFNKFFEKNLSRS